MEVSRNAIWTTKIKTIDHSAALRLAEASNAFGSLPKCSGRSKGRRSPTAFDRTALCRPLYSTVLPMTLPFCRMTLPFRRSLPFCRSLNRFADHSTALPIAQPFCRSLYRFAETSTVLPIAQPFRRSLYRFADDSTVLPNDSTVLPIAQPFRRSLNRFAE